MRKVYDLAQPLQRGMPHSPNHPPFQMSLIRRHGDFVREDGGSAANEFIVTGGHTGTHIDSLAHVSHEGKLFGGIPADDVQGWLGFSKLGIDTVEPIVCRGVLLDIAKVHDTPVLDPGYEITPEDFERTGVQVQNGDAVLVRTGWSAKFNDPDFVGLDTGVPGPGPAAARWLADRKIRVTGGETIAYEVVHAGDGHRTLPVHRILLVESGIHIIEAMDLSGLARDEVYEFEFICTPLNIVGATGSPVRPIAIVNV